MTVPKTVALPLGHSPICWSSFDDFISIANSAVITRGNPNFLNIFGLGAPVMPDPPSNSGQQRSPGQANQTDDGPHSQARHVVGQLNPVVPRWQREADKGGIGPQD